MFRKLKIVPLIFCIAILHNAVRSQTISSDSLAALQTRAGAKQIFKVNQPDQKISPHTGMTRKHWKEAALYLLSGAFSHIHSLDDPMKFPKQPGKSYPRDGKSTPTEKMEGLCRTMFIAGPLLKEHPEMQINGIKVGDYYRYQIAKMLDPKSDTYIEARPANGGPSQKLVEFGGLAASLLTSPEIFWEPLPASVKESLSKTMLSYGDGPTIDMNWRYFNILILSFYKSQNYQVNETLLKSLLEKVIADYKGQGWYTDSPYYDYYSMWAFQMYGKIWSQYFGKKYYPEYASKLASYFDDLQDNYPHMFSRNGEMIMWGRSIAYRMGAAAPFPMMGFKNDPKINYGWMRRIASGSILQFMKHPDFLQDSVPTLGFFGPFEPAVQTYSCRGSAFWLGKLFLGLLVPANSPFWTAVENEGDWETKMKAGEVYDKFASGSNLLITNYPGIGASEIRSWCFSKTVGVYQGTENYTRLAYNSAFPWQADGKNGEVSMAYVYKTSKGAWESMRMFNFKKYEDNVYYRDGVFASDTSVKLNLAEITLPNGILRLDRNNSTVSAQVRSGHYSLPVLSTPIRDESRTIKGHKVRIIDNGVYQLALVSLAGWDQLETVYADGLHPSAKQSAVIDVSDSFVPGNDNLYATLMLWKRSGEKWTDRELMPVKKLKYSTSENAVKVSFRKDGKKNVNF